ncbi:MAG: hypothetical protein A2583_08400 [Bdellovibrionales bacterium RIFOXYD1_FULL_53_11]|nr:MAG: hypothetical protein A2583_08400 [Bdellovibrionales bacterium RIFOXYD1_FULL_53_11]
MKKIMEIILAAAAIIAFDDKALEISHSKNSFRVAFAGRAAFYSVRADTPQAACIEQSTIRSTKVHVEADPKTLEIITCRERK